MYREIAQSLWNWLKNKYATKSLKKGAFSDFFDVLIEKHQISINGADAYQLGRELIDKNNASQYVETVLKPRFNNLKEEFKETVDTNKGVVQLKINDLGDKINHINEQLDEKNEKSVLFALDKEKEELKKNVDNIEKEYFPEKRLKFYSEKVLSEFEKNMQGIIAAGDDDNKVRAAAGKQIEVRLFVDHEAANLKKLHSSFGPKPLINHYPPRLLFIWFLYLLCLILLVSEVGISIRIIKDIADTFLDGAALTIASIIYAIGISAALAVIYKNLIDWFLFKGRSKGILFIFFHLLIFCFMTVFFSTEFGRRMEFTMDRLLKTGSLVLGFLSTCFAIANGFLFREATLLYDFYRKMYPIRSITQILKKKKKVQKKFAIQLNKLNKELDCSQREYESFGTAYINEIYDYIARLENINISSFWLGFDSALAELVLNNHDIPLAIFKNIKSKLFCEKK